VILIRCETGFSNFPSLDVADQLRLALQYVYISLSPSLSASLISYRVQMQMLKCVIHSIRSIVPVPDREGAFVRPQPPAKPYPIHRKLDEKVATSPRGVLELTTRSMSDPSSSLRNRHFDNESARRDKAETTLYSYATRLDSVISSRRRDAVHKARSLCKHDYYKYLMIHCCYDYHDTLLLYVYYT
jgi:hypothetical protein